MLDETKVVPTSRDSIDLERDQELRESYKPQDVTAYDVRSAIKGLQAFTTMLEMFVERRD